MSTPPAARSRPVLEPILEEYQARLDAAQAQGPAAYDRVFDQPPVGVGTHEIDKAKVFLRVNAGGQNILGHPSQALLGHCVLDFIVMRETSDRAIDKKITGASGLKSFVRSFIRADGTSVTLLLLDRHLKDAAGNPIGLRTVYAPVDLG